MDYDEIQLSKKLLKFNKYLPIL